MLTQDRTIDNPTLKHPSGNAVQQASTQADRPTNSSVVSQAAFEPLLQQIQRSRKRAEQQVQSLRRNSSWTIYASVACSSLATLISGWAAAMGPALGEGPVAWKLTCGIAALFTAIAGVLGGVQQGARLSVRLAKAMSCAGRLVSLEIALTVTGREPAEIAKDYEELIAQHQDMALY